MSSRQEDKQYDLHCLSERERPPFICYALHSLNHDRNCSLETRKLAVQSAALFEQCLKEVYFLSKLSQCLQKILNTQTSLLNLNTHERGRGFPFLIKLVVKGNTVCIQHIHIYNLTICKGFVLQFHYACIHE